MAVGGIYEGGVSTVLNRQKEISRRTFLTHTIVGAGLALGGELGCATGPTYQAMLFNDRALVERSEFQRLSKGEPVLIKAPGLTHPVVVSQTEDGQFIAVSAKCTHLGCYVRPSRNFLQCPCHGSTFGLTGDVIRGPAQEPLPRYLVEVKENQIEIIIR
jgi:Rieske Fe-S protein